ncbi:hypothetical protein pb186bvf_015865 [Paramecium bursaria]
MIMQGNELQERREQFRVNIRRQEVGQFLQQRRTVSRPADREIDLNLLIKNLGAQPYNMKILIRNQEQINKDHLIQQHLLRKMSRLDATSNKDILEMLSHLMQNEELSQLILCEQDQRSSLIAIISQLVSTLVQDEDYQFWNLIKIMACNPNLTQSIKKAVFRLLVVYITTNSFVDQLLLQILEIILLNSKQHARQLFSIIKSDAPQFFKVLQLILERSKDNKIIIFILTIIKIFIRDVYYLDDFNEIVNNNLIQLIQKLLYVALNVAVEAINLLDTIMDTPMKILIIQNDSILEELIKMIQFGNDGNLVKISFQLLIRLKKKMTGTQFPQNNLDLILHEMLAHDNAGAIQLALDYLLSENYQIGIFEHQLLKLEQSPNQKISRLSILIQYKHVHHTTLSQFIHSSSVDFKLIVQESQNFFDVTQITDLILENIDQDILFYISMINLQLSELYNVEACEGLELIKHQQQQLKIVISLVLEQQQQIKSICSSVQQAQDDFKLNLKNEPSVRTIPQECLTDAFKGDTHIKEIINKVGGVSEKTDSIFNF